MKENADIISLFTHQAQRTPDSIALVFGNRSLTYLELDRRSDKIAGWLQGNGILAERLVAVCLDRSPDMIVAILGVLKAGAAYVPIDPAYPRERIGFILEDTAANIMITHARSAANPLLPDGSLIVQYVDQLEGENKDRPFLPCPPDPHRLAYVIYTSGSTGKPKGVAVERGSVAQLIRNQTNRFAICPQERILLFSSLCFDASVEQIFLALCNGAALVLFEEGLQLDTRRFEAFLQTASITHLHATPSFLENIDPARCPTIRRVIAGGETCSKTLATRWMHQVDFYNEYGPTETTVTATVLDCKTCIFDHLPTLPIGHPLPGTLAYILDENGEKPSPGAAGELYIAGSAVARGYLNRPELTAAVFLPDPLTPGCKMYRTGDRARCLDDGILEYLGRTDEQIKIRGYRIEPVEIETIMLQSPLIRQGVVLAKADHQGGSRLVGYVIPTQHFTRRGIMSWLSQKLPEYMIPSVWVQLDSLPLTATGKINRKDLPEPALSAGGDQPVTADEKEMIHIWKRLLGIEKFGLDETFFELGGHSLLLARLSVQLNEQFGVEFPPALLFEDPTVGKLTAFLSANRPTARGPEAHSPDPGFDGRMVLPAQRNFFIRHKLNPWESFPDSQIILEIKGSIHLPELENAIRRIIRENEALRTTYYFDKGKVFQQVHETFNFEVTPIHAGNNDIDAAIIQLTTPFDFGVAPLIRVFYILLPDAREFLYINAPHINSDGTTMNLIVREAADIYSGRGNGSSRLQYRAFQAYMHSYFESSLCSEAMAFWDGQFAAGIPASCFPPVLPVQRASGCPGTTVVRTLPPSLAADLNTYLKGKNLTKFHLFLAAWFLLLHEVTGATDILVMIPVQNRHKRGFENILGLLANVLVARMQIEAHTPLTAFLNRCREIWSGTVIHQDLPFAMVLERYKDKGYDLKKNPIGQTFFNYHTEETTYEMGDSRLEVYVPVRNKEVLPLAIDIHENGAGSIFRVSSAAGVYDIAALELMADRYSGIIGRIISHRPGTIQNVDEHEKRSFF